MARILIADKLSERRNILCTFLRRDEHVIIPAADEQEALRILQESHPDLVIVEGNGPSSRLLSEVRESDSGTGMIILLQTPPSVKEVVDLMNQGVNDVLVSPLDINDVQSKVDRALRRRAGLAGFQVRFNNLVGSSYAMQQVFRRMVKVAASDSPALLLGEKGVGKRIMAEQIHKLSARRDRAFASVRLGGRGPAELEAELFGATASAKGRIELSHRGTLYIEDVDSLTASGQDRLLRLLEEQVVERPAPAEPASADIRVLASSSTPLIHKVQENTFRSDLYYCLSSNLIEVPPVRQRVADIPEIVELFLTRYDVQIAGEAMEVLINYPWPGNLDELKNAVEQAVTVCDDNRIELRDLPERVLKSVALFGRRHKFIPDHADPG